MRLQKGAVMKKLRIATIVFLAGTAICLCAIMVLALYGGGEGMSGIFGPGGADSDRGSYSLVLEREIEAGNIRNLKIDYGMTFNEVRFYKGEGEKIIIREYMNFVPKEGWLSRVETDGYKLTVEGVRRNNFLFFSLGSRNACTEIYLPEGFEEQLEEVYVRTVGGDIRSGLSFEAAGDFYVASTSGDIYFPEVKAEEIQADSTSGEVRIAAAQAETITFSTTSGDIFLDDGKGEIHVSTTSGDISLGQTRGDLEISSTSGEVRLQNGTGNFDGSTVSGDIRIEELAGEFQIKTTSGDVFAGKGKGWGKAKTVSGDIWIVLDSLEGDMTVSTTSGNVDLCFPGTVSVSLDFDSTSGECSTFFDDSLRFNKRGNQAEGSYGGGEKKVKVSTVSGDLNITR